MSHKILRAEAALAVLNDPRWAALAAREAAADERFCYSVSTTGIYCRPSCAARRPRPEHVQFHPTAAAAEAAGFRACKRCRPAQALAAQRQAALITELCYHIERAEQAPSLRELAAHAQLSPYHLQRLFKAGTGLTPKAYAKAQRGLRVRQALAQGVSVTTAIHAAGYASQSRFYAEADRLLGMTPTAYRRGGAAQEIRFAIGQCTLGAILAAASPRGLCAIALGDDPQALLRDLQDRFYRAVLIGDDAGFAQWMAQVVALVEAPRLGLALPLDLQGTVFQLRVWQALCEIPAGTTVSYRELARRLGAPQALRAVARACAANPLAVAIPCHRVVRTDGSVSGYRWGVDRKQALLAREAAPQRPEPGGAEV